MATQRKYGYYPKKDAVLKRLGRIEGQVRGLAGMVEADKYCIDILTQISATQKALEGVALELLDSHINQCMGEKSLKGRRKMADELMGTVGRLVKAS